MTSHNFKGFHSIQEVVCTGKGLKPEVKLLSLRLFRSEDTFVLATLNVFGNNCLTYSDYSSCVVNATNTHESKLKVLVYDLEEGENKRYGCKATVVGSEGRAEELDWSTMVFRPSKYLYKWIDE